MKINPPSGWKPGRTVQRRLLASDGRTHYDVPAGGILERIEIHPQEDPLWNLDAGNLYRLAVDLIGPNGTKIPLDVTLVWREVETL